MEDKHRPQMEKILDRIIAMQTSEWGVKVREIARQAYIEGFHQGYLEAVDDDALGLSPRKLKS